MVFIVVKQAAAIIAPVWMYERTDHFVISDFIRFAS
jgi:hypothetical protein